MSRWAEPTLTEGTTALAGDVTALAGAYQCCLVWCAHKRQKVVGQLAPAKPSARV